MRYMNEYYCTIYIILFMIYMKRDRSYLYNEESVIALAWQGSIVRTLVR